MRKRQRERQRETERDRERQRQRDRETDRQTEREYQKMCKEKVRESSEHLVHYYLSPKSVRVNVIWRITGDHISPPINET